MKKNTILILWLILLNSINGHTADNINFNPSNIYLVHVSSVMSENSTKIAGSKRIIRNLLDPQSSKSFIDNKDDNIRTRFTLHHTLGGMVPPGSHVTQGNFFGVNVASTSNIHKDKDLSAYIDPLPAFQGEVLGGFIDDIITLNSHTYGLDSVIIVPIHKVDEFKEKNPNYNGSLLTFDPDIQTIEEKIDAVISERDGLSFKYFFNLLFGPERRIIEDFFLKNNYFFGAHSESLFYTLEEVLRLYHAQIYNAKENKAIDFLPADQVSSRLSIINFIFKKIISLSEPLLNNETNQAMKDWYQDTLNWLNLFELDAYLRSSSPTKSVFLNNPLFDQFVQHRSSWQDLIELADSLSEVRNISKLKIKSEILFPEIMEHSSAWGNLIDKTPLSFLINLKDHLLRDGFSDEAYGLLLVRMMTDIKTSFNNNEPIDITLLDIFDDCLNNLSSPKVLQAYIEKFIENLVLEDRSVMNKKSLSLLNSKNGQRLRKIIWDQDQILSFWDLLSLMPSIKILFADYEDLPGEEFEKKFIVYVRKWAIEKAIKEACYEPDTMAIVNYTPKIYAIDELKSPQFSLLNVGYAKNMADTIKDYELYLILQIDNSKNALKYLVELGCFDSWADLLYKVLPLENLSPYEIKQCLNRNELIGVNLPLSIKSLYDNIKEYKSDETIKINHVNRFIEEHIQLFNKTYEGDRASACFILQSLVDGYVKSCCYKHPEEKVIIEQNWSKAWDFYYELLKFYKKNPKPFIYRLAKKKLDKIMEPVFNKALVVF